MADELATYYVSRMVRGSFTEETFYNVSRVYEPVSGMYGIMYGLGEDMQATEFPVSSIVEINAHPGGNADGAN